MAIRNANFSGGTDFYDGADQLDGAINDSVTTITVDDTSSFQSSGVIRIEDELISYSGKTATTFTGCTRGFSFSTAVSHNDNTVVTETEILDSADLNDTFDALYDLASQNPAFWLNSDFFNDIENFDSYGAGAFSSTGNWTVSTTAPAGTTATSTIVASTTAGGSNNEYKIEATNTGTNSNTGNVTATLGSMIANAHKFIRLAFQFEGSQVGVSKSVIIRMKIGSTNIDIINYSGAGACGSPTSTPLYCRVLIVALGSNQYDAYVGGKKVVSSATEATPNLGFEVEATGNSGGANVTSRLFIDDIYECVETV